MNVPTMKKLFLPFLAGLCCAFHAFAQTPYDSFAPEQGVKPMIALPEAQFKVANTDPGSPRYRAIASRGVIKERPHERIRAGAGEL